MTAPAGRPRNKRREILLELRAVNRWMRSATAAFTQGSTIYPHESGDGRIRLRRGDEYIENQPDTLLRFARGARQVAEEMARLAGVAERHAGDLIVKQDSKQDSKQDGKR